MDVQSHWGINPFTSMGNNRIPGRGAEKYLDIPFIIEALQKVVGSLNQAERGLRPKGKW